MGWLQVQIELGRRDPGPVEDALLALGASAIELTDAGDQPILEPGPGQTPLWPEIRLRALLAPEISELQVRLAIAAATSPEPLPAIQFSELSDRDWVAASQAGLRPLRFGQRLWICPADQPCPDPGGRVVRLEPGLAFGTGTHPTTALCLEFLDRCCRAGEEVLDYGCGSGILALAALVLGAARATAVDNDPQALLATRTNAQRNGLADRLRVIESTPAGRPGRYDGVIANILSGPLMELAPVLAGCCRAGGWLALSGILEAQADAVSSAYARWTEFDTRTVRDGWVLLAGRVSGQD